MLEPLGEGIWALTNQLRLGPGFHLPVRMVVVQLSGGELWLHSPIGLTPADREQLDAQGEVKSLVAPNAFHTSFIGAAHEHYPQAKVYAAPGAARALRDLPSKELLANSSTIWQPEIEVLSLRGMPRCDEYVFYHRASRSLIVTDLLFNMGPCQLHGTLTPWILKVAGTRNGLACSRLLRVLRQDGAAMNASLDRLLRWDIGQVIMAHGEVLVGDNLGEQLAQAFARFR